MEFHAHGWCCTDCMMLIANGETPPEMSEEETDEWLAEFERINAGFHIVPGGEHELLCENVEWECRYCHLILTEENHEDDCLTDWLYGHDPIYKSWIGDTDCYCETIDFTWQSCDTCDSYLGGSRHAITYFKKD